jgi:SulP family sulfate permease
MAPLAALSGVLVVVAWNMIERHAIASLFRSSAEDVVAFSATFFLTVFRDLTEAIAVGTAIAAIAFIRRMSSSFSVGDAIMPDDVPDSSGANRTAYRPEDTQADHVAVYRLTGAVFFASATSLSLALDRVLAGQKALVLDLSEVSLIDSTGAQTIAGFIRDAEKRNVRVGIAGASAEILKTLAASGTTAKTRVFGSIQEALDTLR